MLQMLITHKLTTNLYATYNINAKGKYWNLEKLI